MCGLISPVIKDFNMILYPLGASILIFLLSSIRYSVSVSSPAFMAHFTSVPSLDNVRV